MEEVYRRDPYLKEIEGMVISFDDVYGLNINVILTYIMLNHL